MKNLIKNNFALLLVVGLVSSCQSVPYQPYARDVKKKPNANGIIALKTEHRDEDRQKATQLMKSNCGTAGVKILEEGEVVIGEEATTNSNTSKNAGENSVTVGSLFGVPMLSGGRDPSETTTGKVSTSKLKEWQINYECEQQKKSTVK